MRLSYEGGRPLAARRRLEWGTCYHRRDLWASRLAIYLSLLPFPSVCPFACRPSDRLETDLGLD